ncbi:glycine--tRNA ligase [candidate division Kazan bacterium]|uniref:Glycine--tRNA ligase n=1 Tax=candidate division Kazan bacterium TaxID=2202143 RepID=A0A420ZCE5_UNCK3|nr:MAG: glycine--tRNA ligase [candidate division Kazan bacterium]
MKNIVALCKRRGIIYPGSEIYGGMANTWDYGPYGVLLKDNVKQAWWEDMVMKRSDIVGLDSGILMNPRVWEASGHTQEFADPLVECRKCHQRFKQNGLKKCPECGGELTKPKQFNLMFKTNVGPVADDKNITYLRPETAQGIFVNFKNVLDSTRVKLPFGIAQIGKAFRNEITPGNFTFRTLEFEQFEIEYFVKDAASADKSFADWAKTRFDWYINLGIDKKNLALRKHSKDELAHYAKAVTDIEYKFPFGMGELEGIANRGTFDLKQHEKHSGQKLRYTDDKDKDVMPHIIEPSGGVDRAVLAFLVDAYDEDEAGKEKRVVLRLHPRLAPIKAAILPLVKKAPLVKQAKDIYEELKDKFFVEYDEVGTVGRRYRRQDEVGTPFCITVDFENLEKGQVTVRRRDSMKQDLVKIDRIEEFLKDKLQ